MARGEELERNVMAAVSQTIYREGINATGVDRLSEVAGVSKRTLYQRFGNKDELIGRSLASSDDPVTRALLADGEAARAGGASGVEQIRAVFASLSRRVDSDGFRGCPFVNAAIELVDSTHPAHAVIRAHKEHVRQWFERAATDDGITTAATLSRQLMVVLDGFFVESLLRPDDAAADALGVVDALLAGSRPKRSPKQRPAISRR